jgi:hypothetical protein
MSHPPSIFTFTSSLGSSKPWSTLYLGYVAAYFWLSATSLDFYRGTQLADMDGSLMGRQNKIHPSG